MTAKEIQLTRILKSRVTAVLLTVAAVLGVIYASNAGCVPPLSGDKGICVLSPNNWVTDTSVSLCLAMLLNIGAAAYMVYLNRRFNLLRTLSLLFAAFYPLMLCSEPIVSCHFYGGCLLVVAMLVATALLYGSYNQPGRLKPVYLAFAVIAGCSMFQYGFVAYLPILMIGCGQMRIFRFKTFVAALLGVLTPLWIAWGFGFISLGDFRMPDFDVAYEALPSRGRVAFLVNVVFTAVSLVSLSVANVLKIFSYNSRTRALNGFMLAVSLATVVMTGVDFTNMTFYLPLLYCCLAFQIGHFVKINSGKRVCYIVILGFMAFFVGMFVWNIIEAV